ncbi:MAG: hypothetical protein LC800_07625 [Acidobacteria bacterium]|nr:hypothetical protein [Acidobacteriota bacterium]
MSVRTFEGFIEKGQVKLNAPVDLPDRTKVYVVVPGADVEQAAHLRSPRLARPEQAADFTMVVIASSPDAAL